MGGFLNKKMKTINKNKIIKFIEKAKLPTRYGIFEIYVFVEKEKNSLKEHIALVKGKGDLNKCYTRIHSKCVTGDVFNSLRCDCGEQLQKTLCFLEKQKKGILIYLDQEGRGIGLANKIRAYHIQDSKDIDTCEANTLLGFSIDERSYECAVEILKFLKVKEIKLLTNNPDKIIQLKNNGIKIIKRIILTSTINGFNKKYLKTKKEKCNHLLKI